MPGGLDLFGAPKEIRKHPNHQDIYIYIFIYLYIYLYNVYIYTHSRSNLQKVCSDLRGGPL